MRLFLGSIAPVPALVNNYFDIFLNTILNHRSWKVFIVFGVKGRKAEGNDKRGMATAGMVLGIVGVAATGLVVLCAICAVGTLAAAGSIS